ncbi:hypothetical protein C5167_020931 [Papaver somniferum]|uniref:Uncharacterized protein n=1 Tax=Papaver somniferum TaxID=3469 RepID=A0A4Y7IUZ6_PAPSO|nr:hypothetical protein C5167_020931 [Papaver somniferum]
MINHNHDLEVKGISNPSNNGGTIANGPTIFYCYRSYTYKYSQIALIFPRHILIIFHPIYNRKFFKHIQLTEKLNFNTTHTQSNLKQVLHIINSGTNQTPSYPKPNNTLAASDYHWIILIQSGGSTIFLRWMYWYGSCWSGILMRSCNPSYTIRQVEEMQLYGEEWG